MPAERSLAVLVATYQRPATLATLLDHLAGVVARPPAGWRVRVVVCDNDREPTAAAVCAGAACRPTYVHEPRPGIAAARNALLEAAAADEVVVFIDDDEWPEDGWLAALTSTYDGFDADVVAGPVVSDFETDPRRALVPAFARARTATGTPVAWPGTGNVLIRRAALEAPPLRFRDAYGLSGGSDSMLFLELTRRGGSIVWCDEAVVHELVPASRARLRWVLRRAYRLGNTHTRFDRDLAGPGRVAVAGVMARRAVKAIGWMATGAVRAAAGAVRADGAAVVGGLQRVWRGAGMVAGLGGVTFVEYRRTAVDG